MTMRKKLMIENVIDYFFKDYPKNDLPTYEDKMKSMVINFYESFTKDILSNLDPKKQNASTNIFVEFIRGYMAKRFRIYRISEKFGFHLQKAKINIPCTVIPFEPYKQYWIEFPDNVNFQSVDKTVCFKFAILTCFYNFEDPSLKRIFILSFDTNKETNYFTGENTELVFNLNPDKTLQELIDEVKHNEGSISLTNGIPEDMAEYCVKCLMYIESGEPDLTMNQAVIAKSKQPHKIKNHYRHYSPFDFVTVGYGFHEKMHHTDSWEVSGHFRWQRYGKENLLVKLIWIDAFERGWKESNEHFKTN